MYKVLFSPRSSKSLAKIPRGYQIRIKELVMKLIDNPFLLDLRKMHSFTDATHRLRVGSYRLFLQIDTRSKIIVIADIRRRTTQTYR